ncbi:MAG: hypothetical protein G01um101470_1110 [Parcubacteria group bacterium Gr01-1014_70]|nr:MAG: hypothetical protein G01um101470_1110 [Parcubacteria group bacterium Gr01-1014_70]
MDKIEKALEKLTKKERERVKQILEKLKSGNTQGLDIKKLKERRDIFRVRTGNIRIMYRTGNSGVIFVLAIDRRKEDTYKF